MALGNPCSLDIYSYDGNHRYNGAYGSSKKFFNNCNSI